MTPDSTDLRIIEATARGLPLCSSPYAALATSLGMDATEVMGRLRRMQEAGVIRRIAAVPNHYALGYRHNGMTVWDVDDLEVERLGHEIGGLPFVTHCYQRPRHLPAWPYNLFAMVHGRSREETDGQAEIIAGLLGGACRGREILYSTRILKKSGFRPVAAVPGTSG